MHKQQLSWKSFHFASSGCTAKNDEISPHFFVGEILGKRTHFPQLPKGEIEISVSLQFSIEIRPFPLNFHPRTMGKFWYFLLCEKLKDEASDDNHC